MFQVAACARFAYKAITDCKFHRAVAESPGLFWRMGEPHTARAKTRGLPLRGPWIWTNLSSTEVRVPESQRGTTAFTALGRLSA